MRASRKSDLSEMLQPWILQKTRLYKRSEGYDKTQPTYLPTAGDHLSAEWHLERVRWRRLALVLLLNLTPNLRFLKLQYISLNFPGIMSPFCILKYRYTIVISLLFARKPFSCVIDPSLAVCHFSAARGRFPMFDSLDFFLPKRPKEFASCRAYVCGQRTLFRAPTGFVSCHTWPTYPSLAVWRRWARRTSTASCSVAQMPMSPLRTQFYWRAK